MKKKIRQEPLAPVCSENKCFFFFFFDQINIPCSFSQNESVDADTYQSINATVLIQQGIYSLVMIDAAQPNITTLPAADYSYFDEQQTPQTTADASSQSSSNSTGSDSGSGTSLVRIVMPVVGE